MNQIERIEAEIAPLRKALVEHKLYERLQTVDDIRRFMEKHVFAVWDFMSLLKSLQQHLSCTTIPWRPAANSKLARFVNEIVLDEESDHSATGKVLSHFEMYLEAMQEVGADASRVLAVMNRLTSLDQLESSLQQSPLQTAERDFLGFTFSLVRENKPHRVAAAFTFGREDLLPDVFLAILREQTKGSYPQLRYYLQRHIELDGDEHGPLALEMVAELCGTDEHKWQEARTTAKVALEQRLRLWDEIAMVLEEQSLPMT